MHFQRSPQIPQQPIIIIFIIISSQFHRHRWSKPYKTLPNPIMVLPPQPTAAHPNSPHRYLRPLLPLLPTRLILNCIGHFCLHGDPVVSARVNSNCDYLDICGEPEFMERMESDYHNRAYESGSLVVSGCSFDSVLAELGLLFNSF
ncbi:hypothetical protein RYX36_005684 [Vicia faba]